MTLRLTINLPGRLYFPENPEETTQLLIHFCSNRTILQESSDLLNNFNGVVKFFRDHRIDLILQ